MTIEIAPKAPTAHKAKPQQAPKAEHASQNLADKNANKGAHKNAIQNADTKAASAAANADKAAGNATAKTSRDAASEAGATGFMAILASLGDGAQSAVADASGGATGLFGADAVLADSQPGAEDASALDPSTLLAQAAVQAATLPTADAAALAAKAEADPARNALAAALAGANGNKPATADASQGTAGLDGSARVLHGWGATGHGGNHLANGQAAADKNALAANADAAAQGASNSKAEAQPALDFKMFAAMQEARGAQDKPLVTPMLASLGNMANSGKPEKSGSERGEAARTTSDTTYSATPLGVSSNNGFSVGASADMAAPPDVQAAEQVKYWISQDVQNAELKLDGLGDKPVEVSISLNGNEAHVAFRTDEIQTRDVLESAGAHLKDMLAREGLVLSGVSVGTSGANEGGGGERKPRPGVRQGLVSAAPLGAVDASPRARVPSGRALDLFV